MSAERTKSGERFERDFTSTYNTHHEGLLDLTVSKVDNKDYTNPRKVYSGLPSDFVTQLRQWCDFNFHIIKMARTILKQELDLRAIHLNIYPKQIVELLTSSKTATYHIYAYL